ncbi:MAG: sialate O-acetylesterase, partial [Defluviitaleaceae bacterium]|nr:sialate O-acetylesterase [Defluviitaleaceae bacterium]
TSLSGVNIDKWDPDDSDNLFTLMVETARLASNGKVKGVVWFQGCSDAVADRCDQYLGRFKKLKEAYDEALGLKIPWITFQINRCAGAACPVGWPAIREAQRQAARTMPGVYVIPTNDSNLSDTIHNDTAGNLMIGERAARLALSKIYGRDNFYMAPDVASVSYENGLVRLKLENVRGVLFHQDDVSGFTVADEEGDAGVEKFWVENTSDIIIKTKREIAGGFTVRGTQDPHGEKYPIYDNFTRLPMLSFSVSCDV